MKWTAEEILKAYKSDPSKENMERIAEENGCSVKEVGQFLKEAAEKQPKKKPGRPPKNKNLTTSDSTIINDSKKLTIKVESQPDEVQGYFIPESVKIFTENKIDELYRLADIMDEKAAEKRKEAEELRKFLDGGAKYGSENGVYGEV